MRGTELLRLVWLNISQNKFKSVMTSIGIVVGSATIVLVIAIGRGGQMDVAEQFQSLNAGAIDISYEWEDDSVQGMGGGFSLGNLGNFGFMMGGGGFSGGNRGGGTESSGFQGMMGGAMPGGSSDSSDGSSGFSFPGGSMMRGDSSGESSDGSSDVGGSRRGGSSDFSMPGGETSDGSGFSMPDGAGFSMPEGGDFSMPGERTSDGAGFGMQEGDGADGSGASMPEEGASDGAGMPEGDAAGDSGVNMPGDESADGSDLSEDSSEGQSGEITEEGSADGAVENESEAETENELSERLNQEEIILNSEDVDDISTFVPGISGVTISYSTRGSVEGGNLSDAQTYTVAGVKNSYASVSNLSMSVGEFISDEDDQNKSKVCVLGSSAAKELFGSAADAYESTIYIEDRAYTVVGVLKSTSTVASGISPDDAVFVPYSIGIKYITGESISPTITVISEDVNAIDSVISNVETVLAENYSNAEFTFSDAGSKMEAAESSNEILTLLLAAMAAIVFVVGGIGIMNVLFVSVKERTNEIGILKSIGASRQVILFEFLLESAAISLLGGVLGVGVSFVITPIVEHYDIRVEANMTAWLAAVGFAVLTGTLFGIYPAWKASRLVPVEALNAE